ncbi:hypothetical protein F4604DRAFT_1742891 [Suillus subluteus]|nr:hypothetical protein F4604DRAFT_1742891 [Suillus subluteus]
MRLSFILVCLAAFKLSTSMPAVNYCPELCTAQECCPGQQYHLLRVENLSLGPQVSMSSFLLTPCLTGLVDKVCVRA